MCKIFFSSSFRSIPLCPVDRAIFYQRDKITTRLLTLSLFCRWDIIFFAGSQNEMCNISSFIVNRYLWKLEIIRMALARLLWLFPIICPEDYYIISSTDTQKKEEIHFHIKCFIFLARFLLVFCCHCESICYTDDAWRTFYDENAFSRAKKTEMISYLGRKNYQFHFLLHDVRTRIYFADVHMKIIFYDSGLTHRVTLEILTKSASPSRNRKEQKYWISHGKKEKRSKKLKKIRKENIWNDYWINSISFVISVRLSSPSALCVYLHKMNFPSESSLSLCFFSLSFALRLQMAPIYILLAGTALRKRKTAGMCRIWKNQTWHLPKLKLLFV